MLNVIKNSDKYNKKIIQALRDENDQLKANLDYIAMMTGVEIEQATQQVGESGNEQIR